MWGIVKDVFGGVPKEVIQKHDVIESKGEYEIRKYPPVLVAQVTYDCSKVKNRDFYGFQILAQYIGESGEPKNIGSNASERIAMTVPVITRDGRRESERIAMTAPVITKDGRQESERIGMTAPVVTKEGEGEGEGDIMTLQFLLPPKYKSLEEAPKPVDERIEIKEEGEKKYGVVKFTGAVGSVKDRIVEEKAKELKGFLERDGFKITGKHVMARYNPPWALPFLRTNEVMIPIE